MTTITQARDTINAHLTAAAGATPITYTDVRPSQLIGDAAWARATVRHAGGGQAGLGSSPKKKYLRFGIACLEIFTPPGDGHTLQDTLSQAAVNYLESVRSSPVWYRNIRAVDVGQDGGFEKVNVYADFEYEDNHS